MSPLIADVPLRLASFLAVLLVLLAWERLGRWRVPPPGRTRTAMENLVLGALGAVAVRVLLPWLAIDAARWADGAGFGALNALPLPLLAATVAGFLALDLAVYAQHVAMHRVSWLWRLHAVHHADVHLDATTGLRFHPVEIVLSMLWKIAVVAAVGVPAVAVLAFEIVLNAGALFTHSNVRLAPRIDGALRLLVVTPGMHRVHHSVEARESLRNFSFNLSCWDRLFGTYARESAFGAARQPIGLPPGTVVPERGLTGLLLAPFRARRARSISF
jgi:sterol desaturase/sphingolipid hydroxylase (fatty acid hydroxylase superfamily)